jgi:hypothetical protein
MLKCNISKENYGFQNNRYCKLQNILNVCWIPDFNNILLSNCKKQEHYMNLQIGLLTTHPIQTGWVITIELYPKSQFGCIDNPDTHCGNGVVQTQTRNRSDSPELFLTPLLDSLWCLILLDIWRVCISWWDCIGWMFNEAFLDYTTLIIIIHLHHLAAEGLHAPDSWFVRSSRHSSTQYIINIAIFRGLISACRIPLQATPESW